MGIVAIMNPPPGARPPADMTLPLVILTTIVFVFFIGSALWMRYRGW